MPKINPKFGHFIHEIPYATWGTGDKSMIIIAGGPGNTIPQGMGLRFMVKGFDNFAEEYTLYYITRRIGQPEGFSTRDMAKDCAELIDEHFGGCVDVMIGMSMGGMIAQHFAADYPDRYRKLIILVATHRMSDDGISVDREHAGYLAQGKFGKAMAVIAEALYPKGLRLTVMKILFRFLGGLSAEKMHPHYQSDVVIEAEAEANHDVSGVLERISKPILLICGGKDYYFPRETALETAERIPQSTLILYENRGHAQVMTDKRLMPDMTTYLSEEDRA